MFLKDLHTKYENQRLYYYKSLQERGNVGLRDPIVKVDRLGTLVLIHVPIKARLEGRAAGCHQLTLGSNSTILTRSLTIGLFSLNGNFFELLDLDRSLGVAWVGQLPLSLETLEFLVVFPISVDSFVMFFKLGNSLVFDDHFLVVASTLGRSPFCEVFGKGSENLAGSMIRKEVLSLVLGDEDVLIVMDE